jgi:uncharacterized membrane protein
MVNGLVVILPILLLGVVIEVMYGVLAGWLSPILSILPGTVLRSEAARFIAVLIAFLLLTFIVGAFADTRLGRRAGKWVELTVLQRVPFYNALRVVVLGLSGREGADAAKAVLVTVDQPGLQQLGIRMETLPDGRCAVFLPGSPNPGSGTLVIVAPERLQALDISVPEVVRCLSRWGHGSGALIQRKGSIAASQMAPSGRTRRDASG